MPETIKITSRSNERLVRIRKVRDGKAPDRIFLEGLRLVEEALRSNIVLTEAIFTTAFSNTVRGRQIMAEAWVRAVARVEISDDLFKTVADTTHSQGIAMIARRPESSRDHFLKRLDVNPPGLALYFHETNDPSNLGAVFRTAEAAGVSGVILSEGSADAFSPKALRAGMGANLRIPVWDGAHLKECVPAARERGIRIVAADISGGTSYTETDWTTPSQLIFGSEAHGLSDQLLKFADEVVSIPMRNGVESLNLAVSAGIILFEAVRQRS